jgi:hypothetical protein
VKYQARQLLKEANETYNVAEEAFAAEIEDWNELERLKVLAT